MNVSSNISATSCRILQASVFPDGVVHGFSTRVGGVSTGPWESCNLHDKKGDDPALVRENRRRFLEALNLGDATLYTVCQEHTVRILDVDDLSPEECERQEADGMLTSRRGVVLGVTTADCLPVLLADSAGNAVAALHAGWRGLAHGILEAGLHALCKKIGTVPSDIRAAIGVGIGPCCFEIGPEVREEFIARGFPQEHFHPKGERWTADLSALAKWVLMQAGVQAIEVLPGCTYCQRDLFYSYRRDRWPTGLMMSVIARAKDTAPALLLIEPGAPAAPPETTGEKPAPQNAAPRAPAAPHETTGEPPAPQNATPGAPAAPHETTGEPPAQASSSEAPMRESVMESLKKQTNPTPSAPQDQPSPSAQKEPDNGAWKTLRAFLRHPWGRRGALILAMFLLFLLGYIIGRWGHSDLESQLADRKKDVLELKKRLEVADSKIANLASQNEKLNQQLRESENKRVFYQHRGLLRNSIAAARNHLKNENLASAKDEMHKAGVYVQKESQQAQGLEAYLYRMVSNRIRDAIAMAENLCRQPSDSMSLLDVKIVTEPECRSRIDQELAKLYDALLPPVQE